MNKLMTIARQFRDEEDGAAMIEYSVLIGLITVATIGFIIAVGGYVTGAWEDLDAALNPPA